MTSPPSRRGRRLAGLAGLLGAAVLLVVGKAATAPPPTRAALATPQPPLTPAPTGGSGSTPPSPTTSATQPSAAPSATGTYLGTPVDVGYGTVQVRVTLTGGRITDVQAVRLPSGGRSSEIAAYAAPRLRREVLAAQSAHIDTVSGASFTSDGYARSVQSALDAVPR
jgi:uncharacterized protein with FMN-binding domain